MKSFIKQDYPNLLGSITISCNDIEQAIKNYPLSFSETRNETVEWGMEFPMFLTPFYKYVYQTNKLLKQEEFWKYYLSENKEFFSTNNFSQTILDGLKARVYRTYPSLVRDIHFATFLKKEFTESEIIYNRKLDVEEGIDVLIVYADRYWGINLYTNTKRAHQGRKKKESRHTKFENVNYIELPVDFKGSVVCGKFFLYGEKEYKEILSALKQQ